MMSKEASIKIVNFMTPGAGVLALECGHIIKSYSENAYFFFKKSFSLLPGIDQTNLVYSNDDHGKVHQNCKFHDPRGRGSCARAWPYKSYSENALFFLKSSSLLPWNKSDKLSI